MIYNLFLIKKITKTHKNIMNFLGICYEFVVILVVILVVIFVVSFVGLNNYEVSQIS